MSSDPDLDLQVKGSLPSGSPPTASAASSATLKPPLTPTNPLDTAPSSPPQIYSNLLILEQSLRSQYLHHLARRRKFTFFVLLLFLWCALFSYRIFFLGGSPYFYVHLIEKLGFGGGVITTVLYYATGLYQKTIVEPRRFVFIANRGLRGFNVKLVKVRLSYREWISWWWQWYTFRPPPIRPSQSSINKRRLSSNVRRPPPPMPSYATPTSLSSVALNRSLSPHQEEEEEEEQAEEYLPGGMHLKLVILPRGFSPDFREGWEIYRTEYWGKENEARQALREEARARYSMKQSEERYSPLPEKKLRRASRSGSVSSARGRTPTPDPESRTRRGSTASLKRRPHPGTFRVGTPTTGDISDSGSTTSALGERMRRSESAASSSTGSGEGKKKGSTRAKGKKHASMAFDVAGLGSDTGDPNT